MIDRLADFLRKLAETDMAALPCAEKDKLLQLGSTLWHDFSELMEIHVFAMIGQEGSWNIKPTLRVEGAPDHYDVVVSIKITEDEIYEIEEIEHLAASEVSGALETLAAKYPYARLLNPELAENLH